jgi:Ca-activated chloride channel family protein
MIIFTKPQYLALLLVIPILIFVHIISISITKRRAVKFANFQAISAIKGAEVFSKNLTILYLNILLVLLLVLSISGTGYVTQIESATDSFVLLVDSSRSMAANDVYPTRLEVAKEAGLDFLRMIPTGTRIGVVSFSGTSFIEQELTDDKQILVTAISLIDIKDVGGTDMYNSVLTAGSMLRQEERKNLIIISDGSLNLNTLQDIIDYAKKNNLRIFTLGVGTLEGGTDSYGAIYKLSEETLISIADSTQGNYYSIDNLEDFYASFNNILDLVRRGHIFDMSFYLLVAALLVLIIEFTLLNTRYRTLP